MGHVVAEGSVSNELKENELFPGLRGYLAQNFGSEAAGAELLPFLSDVAIKEGGYGKPVLLRWTSADGTVRRLVLETVRSGGFGHEDRADRASSVVRAADDYSTLPSHVRAAGVGAFRREGAAVSLAGTGEFFLLTEFCEGQPYARDLEAIASRTFLEPRDRDRARALADYLAKIHRDPVAHPTYYRRRLRDLVGSAECIAGVADSYPVPAGFITAQLLERIERLALSWRYRLRDRGDRLRAIHGDFHPWNILFEEDGVFHVLDRSRGAWGDPADDVAALAINYLFFALRTRGEFSGPFAHLFDEFWKRYERSAGDAGLCDVIAPHLAFRALVLANPLWYPRESEETRRRLFRFLLSVLDAPRFAPDRIADYLEARLL
jgi:streptomycin 6-kinase